MGAALRHPALSTVVYTECPNCSTAFRVTAKVLQQARGQVRCGSCGTAFSALDYLSEELPEPAESAVTFGDSPAPREEAASGNSDLLARLDELAGSEDVLIEDTGTEWRVLDELVADFDSPSDEDEDEDEDAAEANAEDDSILDEDGEDRWQEPADDEPGAVDVQELQASLDLDDQSADDLSTWRFDDDTPHPDAGDVDDQDDAGPRRRAEDQPEFQEARVVDDNQVDFILSEPGDWSDLLDEVTADDEPDDIPLEVEEELAAIHSELSIREPAPQNDASTPSASRSDAPVDDAEATPDEKDLRLADDWTDADPDEDTAADGDDIEPDADDPDPDGDEDFDLDDRPLSVSDDLAGDFDDPANESAEETSDPSLEALADDTDDDEDGAAPDLEHAVLFEENAPGVETIIMEGDSIRNAIASDDIPGNGDSGVHEEEDEDEDEDDGVDDGEAARFDPVATLFGTEAGLGAIRGGRRSTDPPGYGVIAATVLCGLLLLGQLVHAYRETLSTYGLFDQTIGPVYRLFGKPVTPQWNIQGWQFESTNGNVRIDGGTLTIVSRISNGDESALPYPLIHVSLTDRWEEIIGSRVLSPGEYLAGDVDPQRPVAPGDDFTAVITVDDPSEDATGFKLNVCYRESAGQIRCATQDFKN